jgi:hypothetical protein
MYPLNTGVTCVGSVAIYVMNQLLGGEGRREGETDITKLVLTRDRLCGLVVRVLGYRRRGPGFDSRALQQQNSSGSGTGSTQPREYN